MQFVSSNYKELQRWTQLPELKIIIRTLWPPALSSLRQWSEPRTRRSKGGTEDRRRRPQIQGDLFCFAADSCGSSATCKEKELQRLISYHSRGIRAPVWWLWLANSCFVFMETQWHLHWQRICSQKGEWIPQAHTTTSSLWATAEVHFTSTKQPLTNQISAMSGNSTREPRQKWSGCRDATCSQMSNSCWVIKAQESFFCHLPAKSGRTKPISDVSTDSRHKWMA